MNQLIIKDRILNSDIYSPEIMVVVPRKFYVKARYKSEEKHLSLALLDAFYDNWHDRLIYDPIIVVDKCIIDYLESIKTEKDKLEVFFKTVETQFMRDVACFLSEGLMPDRSRKTSPVFDFAWFEKHMNTLLVESLSCFPQPTPKK